jgi:RNA polymerase sigma-70 factor (ECF subfamily)
MADSANSDTRLTLLARLRETPTDQAAWAEFVDRYGRQVYAWCRRWRLQEADAEDVTQNVLLDLARQMRSFDYKPSGSFRAWLRTVAYRAWCDLMERRKDPAGTGDTGVHELLHSAEARESFLDQLERECDRELLEAAAQRVRQRVEPTSWEAFRLMTEEGLSGAEAAERLGLLAAAAFKAKSRVQKMLREELQALESS